MTADIELEVRRLGRRFGDTVALDDCNLVVPRGQVVAVLGPSGCGKSTLLKLVAGLDAPTSGEIHVGGTCVSAPDRFVPPERRPINMVFQDFALWPHMRLERIVRYGMRYRRVARGREAQRVTELLALVKLDGLGGRYPRQLSGGQQQRAAIARALATEPRLLLFDEPLSNLDTQLRQQMRDDLADLLRRIGATALYVTHDLGEALTIGDRIVVMRGGRIEQDAPPPTLFTSPATPWVAGLVGLTNRLDGTVVANGHGVALAHGDVHLPAVPANGALPPGAAAMGLFHPATTTVLPAGATPPAGSVTLSAEVERCVYAGHDWRVQCRLGDIVVAAHATQPVQVPSSALLALPSEALRLYPR